MIMRTVPLSADQFCTVCNDKKIQIWRVPEMCYTMQVCPSAVRHPQPALATLQPPLSFIPNHRSPPPPSTALVR